MFHRLCASSDSSRERLLANRSTIDELSREELIVIVREQQLQIAALGKLIEQLKRKKSRQASPFAILSASA